MGGTEGRPEPEPEKARVEARRRALRLLARREKSRRGVEQNLKRAGHGASVIRSVLDELEAEGLIDDLRFSRCYLGTQARLRPRSLRLLQADLRREGIAAEVIEQACGALAEELDESVLAAAAARKKRRAAAGDPQRLRLWLRTRGFSRAAIERALRGEEEAADQAFTKGLGAGDP